MGEFTTPADLRIHDSYTWELLSDFSYYYADNTQDSGFGIITVPKGTITDLASTPRIMWVVFPPIGKYSKAAIIHDYLYANAIDTKRFADDVFLDAMTVLGVPKWRRYLMYWAVHVFGRGNYKKDDVFASKTDVNDIEPN